MINLAVGIVFLAVLRASTKEVTIRLFGERRRTRSALVVTQHAAD